MSCADPICGVVLGPASVIVAVTFYTREQKGSIKGMRFQEVVLRTIYFSGVAGDHVFCYRFSSV